MKEFKIIDNHIELAEKPTKTKKMTATRFASVLGLNKWSTPFQMWCEITKTYEKPFEDTKFTIAGKVIEPKIIKYLQDVYFLDIKSPTDIYGEDYFKKTYGDFYPKDKIFGGMWDAKADDLIVEIKTTSRPEDWLEEVPIYYLLQACLYAHLSNVDTIYMVCAFLQDDDYNNPQGFVPSSKNTIVREFSLSELYPNFIADYIEPALNWWVKYVQSGVSPDFDEKADAEYIKALRTSAIEADAPIEALLAEINEEQKRLDENKAQIADLEKSLKKHKEALKKQMMKRFEGCEHLTKVEAYSRNYTFSLSKTTSVKLDEDALKEQEADIYNKYLVEKVSYTLRDSKNK